MSDTPVCIKGVGFDSRTGGFAAISVDGVQFSAEYIGKCAQRVAELEAKEYPDYGLADCIANLQEELAALKAVDVNPETMLRLIATIKYMVGIAERGTGKTLPDDVTPEAFVLDYVKSLEAPKQQGEPVATVMRNKAGQIYMARMDGGSFDMSKYIGSSLYTAAPTIPEGWRDVANEQPQEAQEVLFVHHGKVVHGAWIGSIFWHNNERCSAAVWMPLPAAPKPEE